MKPNTVFKRAYNRGLSRLREFAISSDIGSEPSWAEALGVSRTTVRAMLSALASRRAYCLRRPAQGASATSCPGRFLSGGRDGAGRRDRRKAVHAMDPRRRLQARAADQRARAVAPVRRLASAVRDYLNRFPQYGLLERRPSGSWVFKGFTEDFAEELSEVRTMFELRSALRFIALADDEPAWAQLSAHQDRAH